MKRKEKVGKWENEKAGRKVNYSHFHSFTPSHFLILLLSLLLSFSSSCSKPHHILTDDEKEHEMALHNKIKSITLYRTPFVGGVKQNEQLSQVKLFDNNGFKTKELEYNLDNKIEAIRNLNYDSAGNLVLVNVSTIDSSLLYKETRSYDENKNRRELYHYLPDGTYKYRNSATYDKAGRMIELSWYWPIVGLKAANKYRYNGNKKIEDTEYDPQGKLNYQWKYNYDVKGNLIEAIQYSPTGTVMRKTLSQYNSENQLTRQISYIDELVNKATTFEYDSKGLLKTKTEFSTDNRVSAALRYDYEFW